MFTLKTDLLTVLHVHCLFQPNPCCLRDLAQVIVCQVFAHSHNTIHGNQPLIKSYRPIITDCFTKLNPGGITFKYNFASKQELPDLHHRHDLQQETVAKERCQKSLEAQKPKFSQTFLFIGHSFPHTGTYSCVW